MGVKRRTANPPPAGSSLSLSLEPKPLGETPPTHHKADDVVVDGGGKVKEGQQRPANMPAAQAAPLSCVWDVHIDR